MRRSSISGRFGRGPDSAHDPGRAPGDAAKTVEAAAVRLLACREHSTDELRRKLLAKGHQEASVATVIEKLGARQWVSDDRYVANFVHHHAKRGQGPVRIRSDLRRQGITDARIKQEFASADLDWGRLAAQVRQRKFGATQPRSLSERAKQSRFLQYRGFDAEQIRAAFSVNTHMGDDPDVADLDADAQEVDLDVNGSVDPDAESV